MIRIEVDQGSATFLQKSKKKKVKKKRTKRKKSGPKGN